MRLARRQFLELLTGAATLSARPGVARAQTYPTRAITTHSGSPISVYLSQVDRNALGLLQYADFPLPVKIKQ